VFVWMIGMVISAGTGAGRRCRIWIPVAASRCRGKKWRPRGVGTGFLGSDVHHGKFTFLTDPEAADEQIGKSNEARER